MKDTTKTQSYPAVKPDAFKGWVKAEAFGTQRPAPWRKRTRFNVVFDIIRDRRMQNGTARLCALIYSKMSNGRFRSQISRKWLMDGCGWTDRNTFHEHQRKLIALGWITITVKYSGGKGIEASLYEFFEHSNGPGRVVETQPTPGLETQPMDTSGTTYLLSEATPEEVAL